MEAGLGANPNKVKALDFIETLNALEQFPEGKNFIVACRRLAGEIAVSKRWEVANWAMRIAVANLPLKGGAL
jgi:hypothetical protein